MQPQPSFSRPSTESSSAPRLTSPPPNHRYQIHHVHPT
jgi:hypothetical protein